MNNQKFSINDNIIKPRPTAKLNKIMAVECYFKCFFKYNEKNTPITVTIPLIVEIIVTEPRVILGSLAWNIDAIYGENVPKE